MNCFKYSINNNKSIIYIICIICIINIILSLTLTNLIL